MSHPYRNRAFEFENQFRNQVTYLIKVFPYSGDVRAVLVGLGLVQYYRREGVDFWSEKVDYGMN